MKSIEECLDIILTELVKNWDKPNNERAFLNSKELLIKFELPDTMQKDEFFKRLIFRLVKDDYVEFNTHLPMDRNSHLEQFQNYPLITIEGYYFITLEKGYTQQKADRLAILKSESESDAKSEKNEEKLVLWTQNLADRTSDLTFWTRLVAIGAIGLVLWEVVAFAIEHHWFSCH